MVTFQSAKMAPAVQGKKWFTTKPPLITGVIAMSEPSVHLTALIKRKVNTDRTAEIPVQVLRILLEGVPHDIADDSDERIKYTIARAYLASVVGQNTG